MYFFNVTFVTKRPSINYPPAATVTRKHNLVFIATSNNNCMKNDSKFRKKYFATVQSSENMIKLKYTHLELTLRQQEITLQKKIN